MKTANKFLLNCLSYMLLLVYILVNVSMNLKSGSSIGEGLVLSFPMILLVIIWSEVSGYDLIRDVGKLSKKEGFNRDLFAISYSVLFATCVSIIFQYNNTDVRGWWPVMIIFSGLYGIILAAIFSAISLLLGSHKTYTIIASIIIIVVFSILDYIPRYFSISFLSNIESTYLISIGLIFAHSIYCLYCKISSGIHRGI